MDGESCRVAFGGNAAPFHESLKANSKSRVTVRFILSSLQGRIERSVGGPGRPDGRHRDRDRVLVINSSKLTMETSQTELERREVATRVDLLFARFLRSSALTGSAMFLFSLCLLLGGLAKLFEQGTDLAIPLFVAQIVQVGGLLFFGFMSNRDLDELSFLGRTFGIRPTQEPKVGPLGRLIARYAFRDISR